MNCRESAKLLDLFVDGELSGRAMREVALHVTRCDPCGREIRERERLQDLIVASLEEQVDDIDANALWPRIAAEIGEGESIWGRLRGVIGEPTGGWQAHPVLWGSLASAVLGGLLAVGFWWSRFGEAPRTEVARRELQIHSLSATSPVAVVRDPDTNTTVIWVGDEAIPVAEEP